MVMDLTVILGASGLASSFCLWNLWRGTDKTMAKVAWTLEAVLPVLGPLVYAMWHDPPPPSDPIDRPLDRPWDTF